MNPPSLQVELSGERIGLTPGESAVDRVSGSYRDAPDQLLETMRSEIEAGEAWREVVTRHLSQTNPWLLRIVGDIARQRWLDLHPPRANGWVLDVGCGWGQWAIPAAARAWTVALEPNPARLAIAKAIAQQEGRCDRMYFLGASLENIGFGDRRFDHIYCIGVLEWVPKFRPTVSPREAQTDFLRKMAAQLAPGGECLVGIENRLGLKYLLGAKDDHTGIAGVSVLDAQVAAERYLDQTGKTLQTFTYTLAEYDDLARAAGFAKSDFFAAFPDYKVPQVILPLAGGETDAFCAQGKIPLEHDGSNGTMLPPSMQTSLISHYRSLGRMGIAGYFAPSFFIRFRKLA